MTIPRTDSRSARTTTGRWIVSSSCRLPEECGKRPADSMRGALPGSKLWSRCTGNPCCHRTRTHFGQTHSVSRGVLSAFTRKKFRESIVKSENLVLFYAHSFMDVGDGQASCQWVEEKEGRQFSPDLATAWPFATGSAKATPCPWALSCASRGSPPCPVDSAAPSPSHWPAHGPPSVRLPHGIGSPSKIKSRHFLSDSTDGNT